MCRLLGVSHSGFYEWFGRAPSKRAQEIIRMVRESFELSDKTYGSPRVWHDLRAACCVRRVWRELRGPIDETGGAASSSATTANAGKHLYISIFSTLKMELVNRSVYRTRDAARADVFDYIERFYNPRRRHSTLNFLSPAQLEQRITG
jgi:putative transposase